MTNEMSSVSENNNLSRRTLFKASGVAAAAVGGSGLLAACGGGSSGGLGSGSGGSGGTLIHGTSGGSSKDTLDAHSPVQSADIARSYQLYEPLLYWDHEYKIASAVAESIEPSADAKTWTIKLKQGVTFHNGKAVTPEDVLFTIQRVAGDKPTSAGGALAAIIDRSGTKKVDASTVTVALKTPYAVLDWLFAEYTFGVVPTDYDPTKPVGTGAFKFKSFTPGKESVFERYDGYWGDKAKIDQIQIQDFADSNALVNALQAGQIQTMDNLPYNLIKTLKEPGRLDAGEQDRRLGAVHHGRRPEAVLRRARPPGAAADLRPPADDRPGAQRLRLPRQRPLRALRPGVRQGPAAAQAGHRPGEVAAQGGRAVRPPGDPVHRRRHRAGGAGLRVIVRAAGQEGRSHRERGEEEPLLRARIPEYPFAQDFWNTRNYLPQAAVGSLKGGTYNETHFNNPKFAGLISTAQATVDESKRNESAAQAQEIEYNEGGYIIWGFRTIVDGLSSKVSGIKPGRFQPLGDYDFKTASVSA